MKQLVLALLLTASCRADVIFNNITGDLSSGFFPVTTIPGIPQQSLMAAAEFTPAVNSTVLDAKIFVYGDLGNFTASLFSDQGGVPFSNLETLGILSVPLTYAIASVSPATTIELDAGTPYWLVVSSSLASFGVMDWFHSADSQSAPAATAEVFAGDPAIWTPSPALQFEIDGTPTDVGSAPEPATYLLLGVGMAGIVALRCRSKLRPVTSPPGCK
jgi:PEP-CTERM motif